MKMEVEEHRLAKAAYYKAKMSLASAAKDRYIITAALMVAVVGAIVHLVGIDLLQPASADQSLPAAVVVVGASLIDGTSSNVQQASTGNSYHRSMSEILSVVASYGGGSGTNSPTSYHRAMSELMSITTTQSKPSNSYSRSVSEQASLSTGMPSAAPMQPARTSPSESSISYSQLSAGIRGDERSRALVKSSSSVGRNVGGTSIYSSSNQGITGESTASFDIIKSIFGGGGSQSGNDGSDRESSSSQESDSSGYYALDYVGLDGEFLEHKLAAGNTAGSYASSLGYYHINLLNGFYAVGVIAIAAKRSHIIPKSRHTLVQTALAVGGIFDSRVARVCLVTLILFIVITLTSSVDGSLLIAGAAFADDALASAYVSATGTFGTNSTKYREWNPITSTWSSEVELPDTGSPISSVKILFSPINSMRVIISYSNNGALNLFTCSSACTTASSWTRVGGGSFATAALPSSNPSKPYDIAFEQSSGRLVIVYDKDLNEENDFYYRTFHGATISAESGLSYIGLPLLGDSEFIRTFKMASKPGADEIVMILEDVTNQDAYAFVWNSGSSSFGNQFTVSSAMGTTSVAGFAIDVAYETSSGAAVVFAGNGANSAAYARWNGAWPLLFASTTDPNPLPNNDVRFVTLTSDPVSTSDKIMICQVDDLSDLTCAEIDGGVLGAWAIHDADVDNTSRRVFGFAWNPTGSTGLLVWGTTSGSMHYRHWSGAVWGTAYYSVSYANTKAWIAGTVNPTSRKSAFLVLNGQSDIGSLIYDGIELKLLGTQTHTANVGALTNEALSIDYQRRPVVRNILEPMVISDSIGNGDDNPSAVVYRSNSGANGFHSVKYREWNPITSTWSSEVELPTTGNDVRDAKVLFSPTSTLRVVVSHSADGGLNLFTCSSACTTASSWTRVGGGSFADTGSPLGDTPYKPYDIAFEQSSGRLVIVYDKDLNEENDFYYRTYHDGMLSEERGFDYIAAANPDAEEIRYFNLAAKPSSNELTMIVNDASNTNTYAFIWNAQTATFGNQHTISTILASPDLRGESTGVAYETSSGASVVFSANGANSAAYARWDGASWSAVSTTDPNDADTDNNVRFVSMRSDPVSTSNKIMICQVDDLSDLTCAEIDGGVLGAWTRLNGNIDSSTTRPADFVWDQSGSTGLALYGTNADEIIMKTWNGSSWSNASGFVDAAGSHLWIVLVRNPMGSDKYKALMGTINSNADAGLMVYDGTNLKNLGDSLATPNMAVTTFDAVSIDFQKHGRVISRSATINLALTDTLSITVTKSLLEQITLAESITKALTYPLSETLIATESINTNTVLSRSISEQLLTLTETITKDVSKPMLEQLTSTETIARAFTGSRASSDQLGVKDTSARTITLSKSLSEQMGITDAIAKTVSMSLFEQMTMTETLVRTGAQSRSISEQMTMHDRIVVGIKAEHGSEQLSLSESAVTTQALVRSISDHLTITDNSLIEDRSFQIAISEQLSLIESTMPSSASDMAEQLIISDAISGTSVFMKGITENLAVTESALRTSSIVMILESLNVGDQFTDISIEFHITLNETLVLPDSFNTDEVADFDSFIGYHPIIIGDSVVLTLGSTNTAIEQLMVQEQLSAVQGKGRLITENMQVRDSQIIVIMRPPPGPPPTIVTTIMPVITMTEKETAEQISSMTAPIAATEVQGTYSIERFDNAALGSLLTTLGMPVYDVSHEASSADIDKMTMILPTFKVPIEMGGSALNGGAFLTPTVSDIPANTEVVIPIDVTASLGAGNLVTNQMTVSFAPKMDSTNFAILITILDNNPEEAITHEQPDGLSAFYIDVSYVGTWPAGTSLSDPAFFFEPPQVTFTITEEWAHENNAERDSNNVPIINLYLLDEGTGSWIQISDDKIESPMSAAVGSVYRYTATLPHFSTYVVTAGTLTEEPVVDSSGSGSLGTGRSRDGYIIIPLVESIFISSATTPAAGENGEVFVKDLTESLMLSTVQLKPLHQRVITIDDIITVTVHVADIRSSGMFGTAVATLNFEIKNEGSTEQELTLAYWYSDPATMTRTMYKNEEMVVVGAGQSIVKIIDIPFSSHGNYRLMIEVESKDGTLSATDIVISIPWLAVNLYVIVIIAIIIVGISAAYVIFAIRRSKSLTMGGK